MTVIVGRGVPIIGKRKTAEEMEKMRQADAKLVKGVFRCHEPRGGTVTLVWKVHKGDPIRRWVLKDGEQYEIPKGLAKHLNSNCSYQVHQHILDANGNPAVDKRGKVVSRMNFESLEFYE